MKNKHFTACFIGFICVACLVWLMLVAINCLVFGQQFTSTVIQNAVKKKRDSLLGLLLFCGISSSKRGLNIFLIRGAYISRVTMFNCYKNALI